MSWHPHEKQYAGGEIRETAYRTNHHANRPLSGMSNSAKSGGRTQRLPSALSLSSSMSNETNSSTATEGSETIRVVVRCRPLNESEARRWNGQEIVKVLEPDSVQVTSKGLGELDNVKEYRFSHAVGGDCTQTDFFRLCGIQTLLDSALDGYAATVFAYGQTGSGKTYSMSGLEEKIAGEDWSGDEVTDGIIPRSMAYLYERIANLRQQEQHNGENNKVRMKYKVRSSYCEIYNEQVYDLLNYSPNCLQVRWNAQKGFFVQDLFVVECETLADVMAVVSEGHRNRRVGSHELNKDSSRSHSLLTVHLESQRIDPDDGHAIAQFGKIVFVDLAGSERLKDSKSEGVTLTETGAINRSLFTLGNVISALSEKRNGKAAPNTFVPYRDSKLTKLLMDSLGGTSKTLMIACCSPAMNFAEETLNTLNYATRVAKIKNKPILQMDAKEQLIERLRQEIKILKMENDYLKNILEQNGLNVPEMNTASTARVPYVPPTQQRRHTLDGSTSTSPRKHSARLSYAQIHQRHEDNNDANVVQLQAILTQYQRELENLKAENIELRSRGTIAERSYVSVMEENERLSSKLEHLEEIFVHNGKIRNWRDNTERMPDQADERTFATDTKHLILRNRQLEAQVEHLRQREAELLAALEHERMRWR